MLNVFHYIGSRKHGSRPVAPRMLTLAGMLAFGMTPALAGHAAPLSPMLSAPFLADESSSTMEAAKSSKLVTGLNLPTGALRSHQTEDNAKLAEVLRKVAAVGKRDIGEVEVLAWQKGRDVKETMVRSLKGMGYSYAPQDPIKSEGDTITLFACVASEGHHPMLGMWVDHGGMLVLAWTPVVANGGATEPEANNAPAEPAAKEPKKTTERPAASDAGTITVEADASTRVLNVMGRKMPNLPEMPKATLRPNFIRGYVYDTQGHPLKGALIGVRSSARGGYYSGASARTDAKGFYEIQAPWGAAHFYCAGYTADYGDLIAAFGLYPADGETEGFATANGAVKNWVLLPYGVADRAKAQDQPQYCGNYFGGTITLGYRTDSDSNTSLPANARMRITLTPTGPMLDGSKGRTIVCYKNTGHLLLDNFYLTNIPIGPYKIKVQLEGGGAVRLKETGPNSRENFGMTPKEATGEAELLLKVYDADPNGAVAGQGHWKTLDITLERP